MAQDWSTESVGKEIRRVVDEAPHITRLCTKDQFPLLNTKCIDFFRSSQSRHDRAVNRVVMQELERQGVVYIGQLVQLLPEQFSTYLPAISAERIRSIRDTLNAQGLDFGMSVPSWQPPQAVQQGRNP